jgi:uncharacterized protein
MMEVCTIPLPNDGGAEKYIIYRPLARLAFIGNKAMVNLANRVAAEASSMEEASTAQNDALKFLEDIDFFEPDQPVTTSQSKNFRSLVLLLTNNCHLRCIYCYAAAGVQPRQTLSETDAQQAIDFIFDQEESQLDSEVLVSLHGGGEPTFAWNTLKNITQYVRSKPHPAKISLTSNAMWSRQQLEWIIKNVDNLGISMDGSPETQDRQRPLVSGHKSSPIVLRNLAELDARGIRYGIRITATDPWNNLPEDVEYLCQKTSCQAIQVEPAFNPERGYHQDPAKSQWQQFAEVFIRAFDIAHSYKKELLISTMRPGTTVSAFCTAPYDALIVAPGGRIVACYEVTSASHPLAEISDFGKIENGQVMINQTNRASLHQQLTERRANCRDCFCYWTCAGDCYSQAFTAGGQGHLVKTSRCDMIRKITEQMLLSLIAEGDGIWKAPKNQPFPQLISPEEEELYGD